MNDDQRLDLIRKAWGLGKKEGYCFFPWMRGDAHTQRERTLSFKEGPAFKWPEDRPKILKHLGERHEDDLFWCPMLFETPYRRAEFALEERCLWADLDTVDPRKIEDYPPTMAWETSPGRYQGLWLLDGEFIWGASGPGMVNQRLTYHLGADPSGWDTTQLLRLPEWANHKPERRGPDGSPPMGTLLWKNRTMYVATDFASLPMVEAEVAIAEVLEDEIDRVDRHALWAEVKLKVSASVREIFEHRDPVTEADSRSDKLWRMERDLADAGLTVTQIVALVRGTVWNKFEGRTDELKRLTTEAAKAVAQRTPETEKKLEKTREEEGREKPLPQNIFDLVRSIEPPEWLVEGIFTLGSCGFIAGEPKSYKSWIALDLALSVASGMKFLNHHDVRQPGPVLYVQEEDSPPLVKTRLAKVWAGKTGDRLEPDGEGGLWWVGRQEAQDPDVDAVIGAGLTVSNPGWLEWLDEVVGLRPEYKMLILDPLMMVLGDVQDTSNAVNERALKPLKMLARKHEIALVIVHHMRKGRVGEEVRGGQRMLGSQAYHAWSDESLYVSLGRGGMLEIEPESKHANVESFAIESISESDDWRPQVTQGSARDRDDRRPRIEGAVDARGEGHRPADLTPKGKEDPDRRQRAHTMPLKTLAGQHMGLCLAAMLELGGEELGTRAISDAAGLTDADGKLSAAGKALKRLGQDGMVTADLRVRPQGARGHSQSWRFWTFTPEGEALAHRIRAYPKQGLR